MHLLRRTLELRSRLSIPSGIVTALVAVVALLASFSTTAMADGITFTFAIGTGTTPVAVAAAGLSFGPVDDVVVKNSGGSAFVLPGDSTVAISSNNNYLYNAAGGLLTAGYNGGAGNQITILSPLCVSGANPGGTCLLGTANQGSYSAALAAPGSWAGLYNVTYVSPSITALFGDPNTWNPTGGDSFVTTTNTFVNGGNVDSADLGSGSIAFQTSPIPEPGTLALLGIGLLGVAGLSGQRTSHLSR